jgi:hypothetical protein
MMRSFGNKYTLYVFLLLLFSGCAPSDRPELGSVRGRVTLDGKPMANTTVSFQPVGGGRQSCGNTDEDGRYELTYLRDIRGARLGKHRVTIGSSDQVTPLKKRLPERYNTKTTLEAEVRAGENQFDFTLSRN